MELKKAQRIANSIVEKLSPYCEDGKCLIAGSVRREKADVKDIEIICIPKANQKNIFGVTLLAIGLIVKGKVNGRYMKVIMHELGFAIDIFMPQPEDFYRQLAIRTGDSSYSHNVIATGWVKKGWVGTDDGLRRRNECALVGGTKKVWKALNGQTKPPVWQSEQEFFQWLGVDYKEPKDRV